VFGIIFVASDGQQVHVNGLELAPGQMIVFRRGSEGHNRSSGACQWGTIVYPEALAEKSRVGSAVD
jgi:hypothetical protein